MRYESFQYMTKALTVHVLCMQSIKYVREQLFTDTGTVQTIVLQTNKRRKQSEVASVFAAILYRRDQ